MPPKDACYACQELLPRMPAAPAPKPSKVRLPRLPKTVTRMPASPEKASAEGLRRMSSTVLQGACIACTEHARAHRESLSTTPCPLREREIPAVENSLPKGKEPVAHHAVVTVWCASRSPCAVRPLSTRRNGAISGTPSTYSERILSTRLDPEVDLVLLEYAVNNRVNTSTLEYEDVRSFERVLRQLLEGEPQEWPQAGGAEAQVALGGAAQMARPHRGPAAVLILNMWRCCVHDGTGFVFTRFHDHLTDHHNILAQYYAVPSVAMRNGEVPGLRGAAGARVRGLHGAAGA
eukprot:364999-Chlamydomonas_euryale.AAC.22